MRAVAVALFVAALAPAARAEGEAAGDLPPRGTLRLDESPELPLLRPYREASERPGTPFARWLDGPLSGWLHRSWQTLDWEQPLAPSRWAPGSEPPINPRPSAHGDDPCLSRALAQPAGWPFVVPERHWFHEGPSLPLESPLVPPWLRRLDPAYAHELLLLGGCRGDACSPGASFPAPVFAAIWDALEPPRHEQPWWECRERPLRIGRHGGEQDQLVVLRCDGSVPDDALERVSILARPLDAVRPAALPPEPDPEAGPGEWVPGVRLLHPRLLWLLHRIALEHPWRAIYLYSGYRPAPRSSDPSSHKSRHADGRALDISVAGVSNEDLFALCHELPDVGCGYYPNNKLVHVDVRPRGTGNAKWIDASEPGEPSRYVDGWPGVVEDGVVVHRRKKRGR
jgi:hypothetical protein